jgi:hypothetical protein
LIRIRHSVRGLDLRQDDRFRHLTGGKSHPIAISSNGAGNTTMALRRIISRFHAVLRLRHGIDMGHHDAVRTPIEHTADQIRMRSTHSHNGKRRTATQGTQLVWQRRFRFTAVLKVDEHPVKAALRREFSDRR